MSTALQPTAAEQALGVSLPSRRDEEWKWTDLKRMLTWPYRVSHTTDGKTVDRLVSASPFAGVTTHRVVILNGRLDEGRSKLKGLAISVGAVSVDEADPLIDLNGRLNPQGLTLSFEGQVDVPVEIIFVTTGDNAVVASRLHVVVADGASAMLLESHVGAGEYLHNPLVTCHLGKGARLDRIKLECEDGEAQHLAQSVIALGKDARLLDLTLTAGAQLSRQNGNVVFIGENASARVNGSYLLKGKQHVDTRLLVDHRVPNCVSRELFKCVMQDQSRGIFQGKVIVRPNAQKTDGKQSSHALLLSEAAEFDAKPELEIYADDVVCGHGTTCGDLNPDHLFYLMSRGIPKAEARAMLVEAFVAEVIDMVENEAVRDVLLAQVRERLA